MKPELLKDLPDVLIDNAIRPDNESGPSTSHTLMVPTLLTLLATTSSQTELAEYERLVVEENVASKGTTASRVKTFRFLREFYLLDTNQILFRALRDIWNDDPPGQPLLAGLLAATRDPIFRLTGQVLLEASVGEDISSAMLAEVVGEDRPDTYSESSLAKIGRNTFASWEQVGLLGPVHAGTKPKRRPECTAATTGFALFLGYLEGVRGEALFDTRWMQLLGVPRFHLFDLARLASARMIIDLKDAGGVVEVGFSELLRPIEGKLL